MPSWPPPFETMKMHALLATWQGRRTVPKNAIRPCASRRRSLTSEYPEPFSAGPMDPLKLIALDQDDIAVVSTHLQDAVVKVADVVWLPAEHRLVLGLNRFDWEACGEVTPCYQRRRTALRFERVMACRCRNVDPN